MKRSGRIFVAMLATAAVFAATARDASAAIVGVGSRGALGGTDFIDWGTLGPSVPPFPTRC